MESDALAQKSAERDDILIGILKSFAAESQTNISDEVNAFLDGKNG